MALVTTVVFSSSVQSLQHIRRGGKCLRQHEAEMIVMDYIAILAHTSTNLGDANATAQALLDENYQEISDSILSLEALPLGEVTFPSKAHYTSGVLNGPPATGVITLEVLVAGCDKILWYWNLLGVGKATYEVKGFSLFTITPAMQIVTTELEFNSIAWGLNTDFTISKPDS